MLSTARLGPQRVSQLGLGCMVLTRSYSAIDETEAAATLAEALDAGITLLDTADAYALGDNERFVGRRLGSRRDGVVLASKFGLRATDEGTVVDGRPSYVRQCCDASLGRLGVDRLDLYYQHRVDPTVPIEETVGAMAELVAQGKVAHLGLCEVDAAQLQAASAVHPIAAVQSEWSLWARQIEGDVLATARRLGVGIVAYAPLGRGFLAGAIRRAGQLDADDLRASDPRLQGANLEHNLALLGRLSAVARRHGATEAQIALAWLMAQGDDVVPIPGTERRDLLRQNLGSLQVRLSDTDLAELDQAFPPGASAGDADAVLMRVGTGPRAAAAPTAGHDTRSELP